MASGWFWCYGRGTTIAPWRRFSLAAYTRDATTRAWMDWGQRMAHTPYIAGRRGLWPRSHPSGTSAPAMLGQDGWGDVADLGPTRQWESMDNAWLCDWRAGPARQGTRCSKRAVEEVGRAALETDSTDPLVGARTWKKVVHAEVNGRWARFGVDGPVQAFLFFFYIFFFSFWFAFSFSFESQIWIWILLWVSPLSQIYKFKP